MIRVPPTFSKESMMNDLFLALAEQRQLKARGAMSEPPRSTAAPAVQPLSPHWGQRLAQILGPTVRASARS